MDRRLLVLVLALAFSAALTASARADVLVAYDKFVSGQGFDIDVRNLQQDGAPVTLPAGVNTPANEFHPTLSGDGRLLAFERDTLATAGGAGGLCPPAAPRAPGGAAGTARRSTTSSSWSSTCTRGGSSPRRPSSS